MIDAGPRIFMAALFAAEFSLMIAHAPPRFAFIAQNTAYTSFLAALIGCALSYLIARLIAGIKGRRHRL
ncbi:hypothetical protein [Swaminathania salitolerans]|uniref:hypothetical protein n=1 Tax=Swaminathania salitolerans TaxID=182838 RepID=UPI0011BD45DB|nr:hypothetical protein [Swaminathania salitolerans]